MPGSMIMLPDFATWARDSNNRITSSTRIGQYIGDAGFVHSIRTRLVKYLGDSPEFYLVITHVTNWLHQDKTFEDIVCKECSEEFASNVNFIWFCFWCSIIIYGNIIKQINITGVGQIV